MILSIPEKPEPLKDETLHILFGTRHSTFVSSPFWNMNIEVMVRLQRQATFVCTESSRQDCHFFSVVSC